MRDDILFGRYDGEYHGSNDFKSTKEDIAEAYVYNENRTKIQDAFNREKDADKIGMLKIFGAKKKSDQRKVTTERRCGAGKKAPHLPVNFRAPESYGTALRILRLVWQTYI